MKRKRKTWGGKREGSGRPRGSVIGRTVVTGSVSMSPKYWSMVEEYRKGDSRGMFISELVEKYGSQYVAKETQ